MTKTTANPQVAEIGRDPVTRPARRDGLRNNLRDGLAGLMGRISTKARWILSAAIGLIAPAVLIAEDAAAPLAQAIACVGNGSFMALAASANAFTLIP